MALDNSQLSEFDRKETKRRVEEALETARVYKIVGPVRREVHTTHSYEPRFHTGKTNKISKTVEEVGIWNVSNEERMQRIAEDVDRAVNRLPKREKVIIQKCYLEYEKEPGYVIYGELNMSESTFMRIKSRAIYLLALMLRLEIFKCPCCGQSKSYSAGKSCNECTAAAVEKKHKHPARKASS